jgi:osmotically-inducible protein OsmY
MLGAAYSSKKDEDLHYNVEAALARRSWRATWPVQIAVMDRTVHVWGLVPDETARHAYRDVVQSVPGVESVQLHMQAVAFARPSRCIH